MRPSKNHRADPRGKTKNSSGCGCLIVLAVVGALCFAGYRSISQSGSGRSVGGIADDGSRGSDPASYGAKATRDTWPPLSEGRTATATDLTAANYYIVLDGSGSMQEHKCAGGSSKMAVAKSTLSTFIYSIPAGANVGLLAFDADGIRERSPLATGNREQVIRALNDVRAEGGTPLLSAMSQGYEQLTAKAREQLGYGEYHLVVVTDGKPDPQSEDPSPLVRRMLSESPVMLHTIGFCIGDKHVLNQPGRTFYTDAQSPTDLARGLESVLAEAPSFDVKSFDGGK